MSLPHWLLEIKIMTRKWLYLHMGTFYFPGNGKIWMHTDCNLSIFSSTFFLVRKHAVLPLQFMYLITTSIKPSKISCKTNTGLFFFKIPSEEKCMLWRWNKNSLLCVSYMAMLLDQKRQKKIRWSCIENYLNSVFKMTEIRFKKVMWNFKHNFRYFCLNKNSIHQMLENVRG